MCSSLSTSHGPFCFPVTLSYRNDPKKPWEAEDQILEDGEILYLNFAPIIKGGSEYKEYRMELYKNYISSEDFLRREKGLPDPRQSNVTKYATILDVADGKMADFITEERGVEIIPNNVFDVDGIRFGLEICLDHRRKCAVGETSRR